MATTINADNGAVSGSAGLKESADSSGVLALQTNGTTAVSISTGQVVTLTNALPVASGGTGATTNAGAAFALKGANSDITSLSGLTTALSVGQGGTGLTTATGALVGSGSAVSAIAAGTAGNVLTSNGTTWTSAAAAGAPAPVVTIYSSPATWTKPATLKAVKVTIVSGGGGGAGGRNNGSPTTNTGGGGGGGGAGIGFFPAPSIPGPVAVTVGTAGTGGVTPGSPGPAAGYPGSAGGTSSYGTLISATGGGGGGGGAQPLGAPAGAGGSITASPTVLASNGLPGSSFVAGDSGFAFGQTPRGVASVGVGYGVGGGGNNFANAGVQNGANGTAGVIVVEEFY